MAFEVLTKQGYIVCQSCVLPLCATVASLWQHVPVRTTEKVELSLCRVYGCPGRSLGDFWKIFWESLALSNQERHQETVGWTDRLSVSTRSQWALPTETLVTLRQLIGDGCHKTFLSGPSFPSGAVWE